MSASIGSFIYRQRSFVCYAERNAKGQAIIEIIASLMMFILMMCLMISISLYLYEQHAAVTAAREGARFAALNINIGQAATQSTGIDEVQDYMVQATKELSGITIVQDDIDVTPPDPAAVQGNRSVKIVAHYTMQNPLPMGELLGSLGVDGNSFSSFPIVATATMHYEE